MYDTSTTYIYHQSQGKFKKNMHGSYWSRGVGWTQSAVEVGSNRPKPTKDFEKNPRILSMKYWWFNRDPYFMAYEIIPI